MNETKQLAYHYTSLDVFLNLVKGIADHKFLFWGSYIFSMNDSTEFVKGYECAWNFLPEIEKHLAERGKIDDEYKLSLFWDQDKTNSSSWWSNYHIELLKKNYIAPFVISFSKQGDSLPQWTMYGKDGNGVSLGFDVLIQSQIKRCNNGNLLLVFPIEKSNTVVIDVEYDGLNLDKSIAKYMCAEYMQYLQIIKNASNLEERDKQAIKLNAIERIVCLTASYIKHSAYKYESEVRFIQFRNEINDVKYRIDAKGRLIPYMLIRIPTTKLKKIVVGPCADYNSVKLMIDTVLLQHGIKDVTIVKSEVPYR